jgi:hypothetical protein
MRLGESIAPQKYPFGVVVGRERSMRCDGGSFAGGRVIRTCHSGIGRSCCHLGRRAYPISLRNLLAYNVSLNEMMKVNLHG